LWKSASRHYAEFRYAFPRAAGMRAPSPGGTRQAARNPAGMGRSRRRVRRFSDIFAAAPRQARP